MSKLPSNEPFAAGKLTGTIYRFAKAGDALPVHVHDETSNHITMVMDGWFRCIGNPAIEGTILKPGMVLDWPVGEPHGFVALKDGSRMLQITK